MFKSLYIKQFSPKGELTRKYSKYVKRYDDLIEEAEKLRNCNKRYDGEDGDIFKLFEFTTDGGKTTSEFILDVTPSS